MSLCISARDDPRSTKYNIMNTTRRAPSARSKSSNHSSNGGSNSSFRSGGSRSGGGSRSFSSRPSGGGGFSGGGSRGGRSNGGGRSGGGNRGKRGSKKDFINENLFINKATNTTEVAYVSKHTFSDFNLHPKLLANLAKKEFITPSPIQDQSIPVGMKGQDVIGIASTGTGKTAAFLLPLINKLVADPSKKVLILAPTRELAQQIEQEFKLFTAGMGLWSVSCVGGAPIMRQMNELRRGVHVVIGTPGRVKDLIARRSLVLTNFHSIVLDEADRMLDMGFVDDMRYILGLMPKERQSFFFSATISPEITRLCSEFLNNPVTVSVKTRDTASSVSQDVVRVRGDYKMKLEALHNILIDPNCSKVLIFREMKRSVDELAKELQGRGFKALALHGDMRNRERERAVKSLALGQAQIVIATDVAARGIDIPDITHVINYDVPSTYDTYIHRIGRTGRGNRTGQALTFV